MFVLILKNHHLIIIYLRKTKILNCYKKIPVFLGNENKKFQISKIADGARNREYVGVIDWLSSAGIVNVSYSLEQPSLPLKGNYNPDNYRLYFADTGLLIGSLDHSAGDLGSIPGLGRSPGGEHGNPLQYSCLENPKDIHRIAKSWTRLR